MEKKIFSILIALITLLVGFVTLFFKYYNFQTDNSIKVSAPEIVFKDDIGEIVVEANNLPDITVKYTNGLLYSERIEDNNRKINIPFYAKTTGVEEVELKLNDEAQNIKIMVCNKIEINDEKIVLALNTTKDLSINSNLTCLSKYIFKIGDSSVISYQDGKIYANSLGKTYLDVSLNDEKYTYEVEVKPQIETISFEKNE